MGEAGTGQGFRGNLDKLIVKINESRGIDLALYRRPYLERRIAARLRVLELSSYRQYGDLLDEDPSEYDKLLSTLTINVTEFYRDTGVWDRLRTIVFRQMIREKLVGRSRTIRVWSAGCATGEEPYSVAMLLLDLLGKDADRFLVSVLATDLDPEVLKFAEAGVYPMDRLKRIPPKYQVRFTRIVDRDSFEISPEVRKIVRFRKSSLFEPALHRAIDLIMCRNVFIYFDREQQARVLDNFWESMVRGGYLILGRSEKLSVDAAARFAVIDGKERIYQRPPRP